MNEGIGILCLVVILLFAVQLLLTFYVVPQITESQIRSTLVFTGATGLIGQTGPSGAITGPTGFGFMPTVGPFGTVGNPEGSVITGDNVLVLEPADANNPGGVSIFTQSFAGVKNFVNSVSVGGVLTVFGATGDIEGSGVALLDNLNTGLKKIVLFDTGGTGNNLGDFYGIGSTVSRIHYSVPTGAAHAFYCNAPGVVETEVARINATGVYANAMVLANPIGSGNNTVILPSPNEVGTVTQIMPVRSAVIRSEDANVVRVEKGGSDTNGSLGGAPFLTVGQALTVATGGTIVFISPGTYVESALTIPAGVSIVGESETNCIITNAAGGSITLITAGISSSLERLTVNAVSNTISATTTIGLQFPGTTAATATARNCVISAANTSTTAQSATAISVQAVSNISTSAAPGSLNNLQDCILNASVAAAQTNANSLIEGIRSNPTASSGAIFNANNITINCVSPSSSTTVIGVETLTAGNTVNFVGGNVVTVAGGSTSLATRQTAGSLTATYTVSTNAQQYISGPAASRLNVSSSQAGISVAGFGSVNNATGSFVMYTQGTLAPFGLNFFDGTSAIDMVTMNGNSTFAGTPNFTINSPLAAFINLATDATSPQTGGALTIAGGLGVGGTVWSQNSSVAGIQVNIPQQSSGSATTFATNRFYTVALPSTVLLPGATSHPNHPTDGWTITVTNTNSALPCVVSAAPNNIYTTSGMVTNLSLVSYAAISVFWSVFTNAWIQF